MCKNLITRPSSAYFGCAQLAEEGRVLRLLPSQAKVFIAAGGVFAFASEGFISADQAFAFASEGFISAD
jgi:hypothetical protein